MLSTKHASYNVLHKDGDRSQVGTFTSKDGVERVITEATRYCSVHGANASIGSEWEYAVVGEDDDCYGSAVAQIWVESLEGMGETFDANSYSQVEKLKEW